MIPKSFDKSLNDYVKFRNTYEREPTQKEMYWVGTQRRLFFKGKLSKERIDAILKVNPNFFEIKYVTQTWEGNLNDYVKFRNTNQREPTQKEMYWVSDQRRFYHKGKLSKERIDAILKVNPNFFEKRKIKPSFHKSKSQLKWEKNLQDYKIFLLNNFREPQSREMVWTTHQRSNFRKGKLSKERIDAILKVNPNFFDEKPKIRVIRNIID